MLKKLTFYVSTAGNDTWSGKLPEPNADRTDGPLRTLTAARDRLREIESKDRDYLVLIRGGNYVLDETVVFGLEDGTQYGGYYGRIYKITYAAYPKDQPVFTSGVPIRGWKKLHDHPANLSEKAKGKVWVADVPEGLGRFFTLYDGTTRLPRARSEAFWSGGRERDIPNVEVKGDPYRTMLFPKGKLKAWSNLEDVEVVIRTRGWTMNILPLESVDEKTGIATTTIPSSYALRPRSRPSAFVENVLEALDSPGEWVLNTQERKLYFWPMGDTPGDGIVAPRLRELIKVEGNVSHNRPTDMPVYGLVFRGLTFTHGDRDLWTENDAAIQHDWEMIDKANGLIRFRGAEECAVENCTFTNSGGAAIRLDLHC